MAMEIVRRQTELAARIWTMINYTDGCLCTKKTHSQFHTKWVDWMLLMPWMTTNTKHRSMTNGILFVSADDKDFNLAFAHIEINSIIFE